MPHEEGVRVVSAFLPPFSLSELSQEKNAVRMAGRS